MSPSKRARGGAGGAGDTAAARQEPSRERLIRILIDTGAFQASDEPAFRLASGAMSRFYVDCRRALSHPEARKVIGSLVLEAVDLRGTDAVGGLVLGALPIAQAVSDAAYDRGVHADLRVFAVRKEPKGHGLEKWIEGDVEPGHRVLIVDDVVTSGGSTVQAIERSREEKLDVLGALVVIDRREQDGRGAIERTGVPFHALLTLDDLLAAKRAGG